MGEEKGGEERWQTPNYLAGSLLASLICAPLHMLYAYETCNVINRFSAVTIPNSKNIGNINILPIQQILKAESSVQLLNRYLISYISMYIKAKVKLLP